MREIKFRAWNGRKIVDIDEMYFGRDGALEAGTTGGSTYLVDPKELLMQYTGLKDKNGKEIYEGDVLLYDGGDLPKEKWSKAVVEWDQQGMWTHPGHSNAPDDWFIRPSISEVIGNIHENPELLEQ